MENKTILLVEDNSDEEVLMVRALKKNNIQDRIIVARDGKEAIDIINEEEKIDVILLDLNLPQISGIEVLRHIRTFDSKRSVPVVILSSSREQMDIHLSYQLGANSYVRKPINFNEFSNTVGALGSYWLHLNELPYQ